MICIGHRGAKGHAPENTLLSVRTALEMNVDWIEVDVYLIEDLLVVFHDEWLERTTNGEGLIYNKSLNYLRSLDAGKGEKIPFLEEVLEEVNAQVCLNVEMKGAGTAVLTARTLEDALHSGNYVPDQLAVSSFNHPELSLFKKLLPEVQIGALVSHIPVELAAFASELNAASVNAALDFVSREFVEDTHRRGLKFLVYTVNNPVDLDRMVQLGVDGVFTDYPEVVTRYRNV